MKIEYTNRHLLGVSFAAEAEALECSREAVEIASLILDGQPLPLRPLARGSLFQVRVWQVLAGLRSGHTATYSDVALRVGSPRATRAVGNAVGRNPLAVVIPCHRILRSDGSIGGYRWGVEVKCALLRDEGIICPG